MPNMLYSPGRVEIAGGLPVEPPDLPQPTRQDASELVPPEHVDDEVGGGVDGQEDVGHGHQLLDQDRGLADVLLEGASS